MNLHTECDHPTRERVIEVDVHLVFIKIRNDTRQFTPGRVGKVKHHARFETNIVIKLIAFNHLYIIIVGLPKAILRG